jgi:hypothetical protein
VSHPQFDPSVIERYAEQLYRKADSVRIGSAIAGAVLGVIFGAAPMSPLGEYLPVPAAFAMATVLLGALVGGFIGYVVGEGRAFQIRLQAQMVLFQVQLERNTSAAGLSTPVAAVAAPAPAPVALPVAAPVAAPAPVQAQPAPEPLIPIQAATPPSAPAQPLFPIAPPVAQPAPVAAARPPLEAVPPLDPPAQPEPARMAEDLAPPLLPPLSPTAN